MRMLAAAVARDLSVDAAAIGMTTLVIGLTGAALILEVAPRASPYVVCFECAGVDDRLRTVCKDFTEVVNDLRKREAAMSDVVAIRREDIGIGDGSQALHGNPRPRQGTTQRIAKQIR